MIYIVDIDGTICTTPLDDRGKPYYYGSTPIHEHIRCINRLYDAGHEIHYWTARGTSSGLDWSELTTRQLQTWGAKYHSVRLGKPSYDIWIDDKAINALQITLLNHEQAKPTGSASVHSEPRT